MALEAKVLALAGRTGSTVRPAVFLDRDGVIIENRAEYVRSWADVFIYPQALAALARLKSAGWPVVVVTNQSMVGRGLVSLAGAEAINRRLVAAVASSGGHIERVYMCPHAPEANCDCRKPQPGLLLQAAEELSLDLKRSLMVGDALSDIGAAQAAGVGSVALVRTGRGAVQAQLEDAAALGPPPVYDTLYAAVEAFLASTPSPSYAE